MYNKILSTNELIQEMMRFKWERSSKELHLHHTWKPTHKTFEKAKELYGLPKAYLTIQDSMKTYHTKTNGWADIAQHLTLMPDGMWVVGRDWNKNPVSISGRNLVGFMIEMVGNFDLKGEGEINSLGYDELEESQLDAIVEFTEFFMAFTGAELVFHRDYSTKTCPGTGIEKEDILESDENEAHKWQIDIIKRAFERGLIKDLKLWIDNTTDPMPTWAVLQVIMNLEDKHGFKK